MQFLSNAFQCASIHILLFKNISRDANRDSLASLVDPTLLRLRLAFRMVAWDMSEVV